MRLEHEHWKQLYAVFNPAQRLELADADLYVERPGAFADKIAGQLRLADAGPEKWVVCGSMGSGKSSELVHLGGILQGEYAVIGLDLPNTVTQISKIQPAEVLFLIGAAAVRAAEALWGHAVEPSLVQRLTEALRPLLASRPFEIQPGEMLQGVALFTANLAAGGAAGAVGAAGAAARALGGALSQRVPLRRPSPLSGLTRPLRDSEPDVVRLQEAVDAILDDVRRYRQPLVLVDGLDKISDRPAIRCLFAESRMLALPRAPIIYTGPITLMLSTEWQDAGDRFRRERLTNIVARPPLPGRTIEPEKIAAGRDALRDVIRRRLTLLGMAEPDVFAAGCVDRLIDVCGGVLRQLVHLVRYAVEVGSRRKAPQITPIVAEEAIAELRQEFEVTMNGLRREELVHVLRYGEPSGREVSYELLLSGYVLPYRNGKVWFEPHPILGDDLAREP